MKRILCLLLCLMLLLSGCSKGTIANFYYRRAQFQYGQSDGVIAQEERDITGHSSDLSFLLSLYLVGPHNTDLVCPFPEGTKLLDLDHSEQILTVMLTDTTMFLSDAEYTLACACLAMTCLDLTDTQCITVVSGERSLSLTRDVLTLYDSGVPENATEGEST